MSDKMTEIKGVTVVVKANVFFDGKVVSHTILRPDNTRQSLGIVFVGKFHFGTKQAERMEITAGECDVKVDGEQGVTHYVAGQYFNVPQNSGFDIDVKTGVCEYLCTFLV